jgi:hypothetical protein
MSQPSENQAGAIKKSELARAILTLKGKPLDLENYKPFELIYDVSPPELVIKAGRQIGKSVSMAGMTVVESIARQYFNTLYIAPLSSQTSRFSSAYLDPFLYSHLLKKHFLDAQSKKNVFEKSLNTGSRIYLSYAETEQDADRVRGASADQLFLDEIQDISQDAIPILKETLSASEYSFVRYTGTAKTENNTLEIYWRRSNMMEWVCKCDHCGKYSIPNDFETCMKIMNNPEGPGCIHCGKVLDMKKGQWLAAKPHIKDMLGFHTPQFTMPARCVPKKWKELRAKAFGTEGGRGYSTAKLANEVFGLASGVGGRILSQREAMACCNSEKTAFDDGFPTDERGIICTTLGVDWSVSGSTKSYTVITVLGYDFAGKCYLLFTERLNGVDILEQVKRVEYLYQKFKCTMLGSDRGVGVLQGQIMQRDLGDDRVNMINYVAAKSQLRWDKEGGFWAADRTMNIDTTVVRAKMGITRFETPAWSLMSEYWQDALNVFEEETLAGRRVYRKDEDLTDDWLHSVTFANIAYMIVRGDFTYIDDEAGDSSAFDF